MKLKEVLQIKENRGVADGKEYLAYIWLESLKKGKQWNRTKM